MKKYIFFFFWGITLTLHAQIVLPVPLVKQKETKWCGAAAAECVLKYNKINIGQCDIMDYVRGLEPLTYGGNSNDFFCCFPPNPSSNPCNKGMALGYDYETVSIHNVLTHYASTNNVTLVSFAAQGVIIQSQIVTQVCSNYGQPMIAQWDYTGTPDAHVVVICGIENGEIQYMDPDYSKICNLTYEKFKQANGKGTWNGYLLLSSPYPVHCFDCDKNFDETGIDCGGSCKPCNAPPPPGDDCSNCIPGEVTIGCGGTCTSCGYVGGYTNEKNITNTAQLSSEIIAFKKITAGGATTVASGQEVSFITKNTGSIFLLPGFTAENGSTFRTQMKDLSQYERICGAICYDYILPTALTKPSDDLYIYNLLYALEFRCDIYNSSEERIFSNIRTIKSNGDFYIWDCLAGVYDGVSAPTGKKDFKMKYTISYCNGAANFVGKEHNFSVNYVYEKSLNEDPEISPQFSPPLPDNSSLESATAPPNFAIIPNPNTGTFQLETNFPLSNIGNLKVTNFLGVTIYETQNVAEHTIQLQNTASGMFFVVMILKDGSVLTQKMMVQR